MLISQRLKWLLPLANFFSRKVWTIKTSAQTYPALKLLSTGTSKELRLSKHQEACFQKIHIVVNNSKACYFKVAHKRIILKWHRIPKTISTKKCKNSLKIKLYYLNLLVLRCHSLATLSIAWSSHNQNSSMIFKLQK